MPSTLRVVGLPVLASFVLLPHLEVRAQEYRNEQIPEVGIEIFVSNRLKRLPNRLDSGDESLKARFRPQDTKDFVQTREGPYAWYTNIREFKKASAAPITGKREEGDDKKPPLDPRLKELLEKRGISFGEPEPTDFAGWFKARQAIKVITEGKAQSARGKFLPYKLYEWITQEGTPLDWFNAAAVYDFPDKEVALVISMPLTKGQRPVGKFSSFLKKSITSGRALSESDLELDASASKDKYADTEKKKEALTEAKKNIQSLRDWDYFTTPNYIVLYSWGKPDEKMKSYAFCKRLSGLLEVMRELYVQYYPPHEDMGQPYSVFRVCATYAQFRKYGDSPPGVVGWFSPNSKELVVFQDGDKIMHKGATDAVTYHEGWHQYSDSYYGGARLQRWFDEGHGDFFGGHARRGNDWRYIGSRMRYEHCREMVRKEDFVPFDQLVTWNKDKFYTGRGYYYYAQAFSMIDFFRRGQGLGRKFEPRWGEILPIYSKTMLQEKDQVKAVQAAFEGVDYRKLEEVWKEWVESPHFKKGK